MKKVLLTFIFTLSSLFTTPAFAWPEVDHMNMCGSATKVVRTYGGNAQNFAQRDQYLVKRGNSYYYRTNCPTTVAPVKAKTKKMAYKASSTAKKARSVAANSKKVSKAKSVKKITQQLRGAYDEHADCLRVDRMNNYGRPVNQLP